ncbi:MAG TPA: hypothetical protein VF950_24600 [Planctomycetota bacterium]
MSVYPFRGVLRWLVLPAILATAGALNGLLGWGLQREEGPEYLPFWVIPETNHALAVGLALAAGRHPAVALALAFPLGWVSIWADREIMLALPLGISWIETPWAAAVAGALGAAFFVGTHLLYLRARRKSRGRTVAVVLLYVGVGVLSAILIEWGFRGQLRVAENLRWGTQGAVLSWVALVVAVRLAEVKGSERAAPAPTPPAPNV